MDVYYIFLSVKRYFLKYCIYGGNSKMAVENKHCRGDGPSSSLLLSSGPEVERLLKIQCISISVPCFQTITRTDANFLCLMH